MKMVPAKHAGSTNFSARSRGSRGVCRNHRKNCPIASSWPFFGGPNRPAVGGKRWRCSLLKTVMAMKPKSVSNPPCQEIVMTGDEIDLGNCQCRPAGPANPPHHVATGRDTGSRQQIEYRYLPHAGDRAKHHADALASHRGGAKHANDAAREGSIQYCGGRHRRRSSNNHCRRCPRAGDMSEYQFAGLLRGRKLALTDCRTVPLQVPAEAEIVIEGHVSLTETDRKDLMAIIRGLQRRSRFRCLPCPPSPRGKTQSI